MPGGAVPPLAFTLTLLALLAPRSLAGALAVFTLSTLASLWPYLKSYRPDCRALLLPLVTLLAFAASACWSPSPRRIELLTDTAYVLAAGAALFATLPAWPPHIVRRTIHWVMAAIAIGSIVFAAQYAMDFPLTRTLNDTPHNANLLTTNIPKRSACALVLLLWPALLFIARRLERRAAITLGLTLAIAVAILTANVHSRAALIGLLASGAVFALSSRYLRIGQIVGFALLPLGIPLALATAYFLPQLIGHDFDPSGEARLEMWHAVWQHLSWLGAGLDASRVIDPVIQDHPHNMYLQWALEGGLGGSLLVMGCGLALWQRLRRASPALQPFIWALATAAALMLAIAYGAWQGWWLGLHLTAAFWLALLSRASDTSAHAPPADQRP